MSRNKNPLDLQINEDDATFCGYKLHSVSVITCEPVKHLRNKRTLMMFSMTLT